MSRFLLSNPLRRYMPYRESKQIKKKSTNCLPVVIFRSLAALRICGETIERWKWRRKKKQISRNRKGWKVAKRVLRIFSPSVTSILHREIISGKTYKTEQ